MRNIKWPAPLGVIGRSVVAWWDGWLDFELITIAWFFAQFTIILGPPATFGVYHVVHVMAHEGEATGLKGMFHGARLYFGKALIWGVINWAALVLAYVNIVFYSQMATTIGMIAQWIVIFLTVLYLVAQFYAVAFFMQLRDDSKNVFQALKSGLFMALTYPVFTFVLILFAVVLGVFSAGLVIPIFLGAPALIAVLSTEGMRDRLQVLKLLGKDPDPREVG
jgi:uncharacterized membrane protein YesL